MKKILCIAIFSVAIMANANNEKEVVVNNSTEIITNTTDEKEIFEDDSDCGDEGDLAYSNARNAGLDHREARSIRRTKVRECRGGTWAWIGVCIGLIGHCDQ